MNAGEMKHDKIIKKGSGIQINEEKKSQEEKKYDGE